MKQPYSFKYEIADFIKKYAGGSDPVIYEIIHGQTFRLPHENSLPEVKDYSSFYDLIKLPYSCFLIEVPVENNWWIMVVKDFRKGFADNINENWDDPDFKDDFIYIMTFLKKNEDISASAGFELRFDETGYECIEEEESKIKDNEILRRYAWFLFELCISLNTPNIPIKEIKSPKLINRKRKAKGEQLLAGYKYLCLGSPAVEGESTGEGRQVRQHWRRGHIRRLEKGPIWIKPMLIGKGNYVDKTYKI